MYMARINFLLLYTLNKKYRINKFHKVSKSKAQQFISLITENMSM